MWTCGVELAPGLIVIEGTPDARGICHTGIAQLYSLIEVKTHTATARYKYWQSVLD